jgi:hypothetical protein
VKRKPHPCINCGEPLTDGRRLCCERCARLSQVIDRTLQGRDKAHNDVADYREKILLDENETIWTGIDE